MRFFRSGSRRGGYVKGHYRNGVWVEGHYRSGTVVGAYTSSDPQYVDGSFPDLPKSDVPTAPHAASPSAGNRKNEFLQTDFLMKSYFIGYDDETILDTRTGLMWAAQDNSRDTNWEEAMSYCQNYRGGGHTDWRMPTQNELAELNGAGYQRFIKSDSWENQIWASETVGSTAAGYSLDRGQPYWDSCSVNRNYRALPVRFVGIQENETLMLGSTANPRFIAGKETFIDANTNLMWAMTSNVADITWADAKSYCENYAVGGYTDWRMPTQDELVGLRESGYHNYGGENSYGILSRRKTGFIFIQHWWVWASETSGNEAAVVDFHTSYPNEIRKWSARSLKLYRALPVRSVFVHVLLPDPPVNAENAIPPDPHLGNDKNEAPMVNNVSHNATDQDCQLTELRNAIARVQDENERLKSALKTRPSLIQVTMWREQAEKKRIEIAEIVKELKVLSITQFGMRKRLLARLEELTAP